MCLPPVAWADADYVIKIGARRLITGVMTQCVMAEFNKCLMFMRGRAW
jgi:hypothetical protein